MNSFRLPPIQKIEKKMETLGNRKPLIFGGALGVFLLIILFLWMINREDSVASPSSSSNSTNSGASAETPHLSPKPKPENPTKPSKPPASPSIVEDEAGESTSEKDIKPKVEELAATGPEIIIRIAGKADYPLCVRLEDTVLSLRKKIAQSQGVDLSSVVLLFSGGRLEDGRTLAESKIKDGSILGVSISPANNYLWASGQAVVRKYGTSVLYTVSVSPSTTVEDLKKKIFHDTDCPYSYSRQRIFYNGVELSDNNLRLGTLEADTIRNLELRVN